MYPVTMDSVVEGGEPGLHTDADHAAGSHHKVFPVEIADRHIHEGLGRSGVEPIPIPLLEGFERGEVHHLTVATCQEQVDGITAGLTGHGGADRRF